jgi:hypothetical protein
MQSVSIPIRFTQEEKYVLQKLANTSKMPLSTYITTKLKPFIDPEIKTINKTSILINQLKSIPVDNAELVQFESESKKFRKNFKPICT